MTDYYCDGGPVPATPEEFAAEVQAIVIDPRLTSGAAIDTQLGQLATAYADELTPGGLRRLEGPWSKAAATGDEITAQAEQVQQLAARLDESGRAVLAAQLIGSIAAAARPSTSTERQWINALHAKIVNRADAMLAKRTEPSI